MFDVMIESSEFKGKRTIQQHRMVTNVRIIFILFFWLKILTM